MIPHTLELKWAENHDEDLLECKKEASLNSIKTKNKNKQIDFKKIKYKGVIGTSENKCYVFKQLGFIMIVYGHER